MKRTLLLFSACMIVRAGTSQVDSSDFKANSLHLFKTEEDFFAKKSVYRGQILPSDEKVINYTTADSKKRKLNLEDSSSFYFGYQVGDEILIKPGKKSFDHIYYTFGGGTINAYCVVYGKLPNYDKQGFLLGLTSPGGRYYMYFIDHTRKLTMVQVDEFLRSKPQLLEKYHAEKKSLDKENWERKKLAINIKYLKLFLSENK